MNFLPQTRDTKKTLISSLNHQFGRDTFLLHFDQLEETQYNHTFVSTYSDRKKRTQKSEYRVDKTRRKPFLFENPRPSTTLQNSSSLLLPSIRKEEEQPCCLPSRRRFLLQILGFLQGLFLFYFFPLLVVACCCSLSIYKVLLLCFFFE